MYISKKSKMDSQRPERSGGERDKLGYLSSGYMLAKTKSYNELSATCWKGPNGDLETSLQGEGRYEVSPVKIWFAFIFAYI